MGKIVITGGAFQGKGDYALQTFGIPRQNNIDFEKLENFWMTGLETETNRKEGYGLLSFRQMTDREDEMLVLIARTMAAYLQAEKAEPDAMVLFHHCHRFVYWTTRYRIDAMTLWNLLLAQCQAEERWCAVMDEIGGGIVPVDSFEREYRENTGRFGCALAAQAEKVIRVHCGIGVLIK